MAIEPKGIIVHSMAEYLKMPEGPMKAHDFLKSVNLSVHGFIHPDGTYEKMVGNTGNLSRLTPTVTCSVSLWDSLMSSGRSTFTKFSRM